MSDTPIFDNVNRDNGDAVEVNELPVVNKPEPILGPITGENEVQSEKHSLVPQPKVAAAGIAGAITVLVVFAVGLIWPNVEIPNEVAAAFTALVAFAAGYIKS